MPRFAAGTPYETDLGPIVEPERVMPLEVAQTVQRALTAVVTGGTARRINNAFTDADGKPLGTNHITSILGGCALHEEWTSVNGKVRGVSINTFDPADRRWHQEWVDTSPSRLTISGGLVDGRMVMEQREPASADGKVQVQRITWTPLNDGRVRQQWEVSSGGGAAWKTAFDGYYAPQNVK